MAQGKKSFILYSDYIHTIELLSDEDAGKLLKHIFRYVNDLNPESDNLTTKIAFEPIKQQLKRDLKDWEEVREGKIESGRLGGIKSGEARRKQKEANEANASKSKQKEANEAVTVNVTVNDNVTIKEKINFSLFWDLYPTKIGKAKCLDKWNRLTFEVQTLILEHLQWYKDWKEFAGWQHPHPETYLNQKRWEDGKPEERPVLFPKRKGFVS